MKGNKIILADGRSSERLQMRRRLLAHGNFRLTSAATVRRPAAAWPLQ